MSGCGPADGPSDSGTPFLRREFDQSQAQLSPDGRRVAYVSERGWSQRGVRRGIPRRLGDGCRGLRRQPAHISEGGGFAPRWRGDGRELFYLTLDGSVMAVEVNTDHAFRPGAARRLFRAPGVIPEWGVTKDGARLLFAVPVTSPPPFDIVQNWQGVFVK